MEYCTSNPRKIYKMERGNNGNKNFFSFLRKSLDLLKGYPKSHHQHIIMKGKAYAIHNHGTKDHTAAGKD